jgi:AcrR family transcriptional regulator
LPRLRSEQGALVATQPMVQAPSAENAAESDAAYFKLKPGPGKSARDVRCHQQARIHSAMLEVIAEQGYDAATVRRLAQRAGVSTRTFYQHYSSKEECFLHTQGLIALRWSERVVASQEAGSSDETRLRLGIRALLQTWVEWPAAARLMLVDAWAGGPLTLSRSRRSLRSIASKCSGSDVSESRTATLLAEGVVAGLAGVMRSRLVDGRAITIEDELLKWVVSCTSGVTFDALTSEPPSQISSSDAENEDEALVPEGDRAFLLSAICRLAATEQFNALTPKMISKAAGVTQRKFHAVFSSAEDCVNAAVEWRIQKAVDKVRRQCHSSTGQLAHAYRSAKLLCAQIFGDVALVNLCSGQLFGMACTQQLHSQEHMAEMIGSLIPSESAEIATEASIFSILEVLQAEIASRPAARTSEAVSALACLLLAPAIRGREAIDCIGHRIDMAAA